MELLAASEVRYEMKIEIKAAYDPLHISEDDLEKDFRSEIARVIRQLEGISTEEAQDQIHRVFEFDLCARCQRKVVRDPLSRD